jgi:ATP-dependent Clp protease ATP-binding subunit ClpC
VEDKLAEEILDGTVKEGDQVEVAKGQEGLLFAPKELQMQG